MFSDGRSFRGSRGACFAVVMKNLPPMRLIFVGVKSLTCPFFACPYFTNKGPACRSKIPPDILIAKYRNGETNAVSLLHQLAHVLQFQLEFKETVTTGNVPCLYFAFCVVIDGVEYKTGMGIRKKEARLRAAELALDELLPTLESLKSALPEVSIYTSAVKVCCQVRWPVAKYAVFTSIHTLAFLPPANGFEVVALGTGNFNTKESVSSNGRIVHDSHAVVTARRSLMRFLYRHLLMFFSKNASMTEKSIFQQNSSSSSLLSLKNDISLHLYVNQLPKGAAQIPPQLRFNPLSISALQVNNEIGLHLSVEGKVRTAAVPCTTDAELHIGLMSTTDKITQWQVLGYQGALLSHFIEPVYVQSILIGDSDCREIRGMEISVSQRVEGITSQLPMFYCMMRPHISLVPSVATNSPGSSQLTYSVNWSEGDSSLEVVDGLEGKTIDESPFKSGTALASRLCKAAMLHRFNLVAKEAQRQDLLATSSYREAKRMAKPYQEAKNVLRAYLLQQGFGSWLDKVWVRDNFSM
uniref:Adenosine deaminase domain containing 1 (testis-specific) n=1 Tax=Acanthochromis polyacanthus TaxID=80966 RepID=A0A3Q1FWL1_9TELE